MDIVIIFQNMYIYIYDPRHDHNNIATDIYLEHHFPKYRNLFLEHQNQQT